MASITVHGHDGGMATQPAIEVTDLEKNYGSHRVIKGLSLSIPPGQTYALLGPNGAGKSTIVEILEGFRRRSDGQVRVLGQDPHTAGREWRDAIGVVLQEAAQPAVMSVREQLEHLATFYSHPRDVARVLTSVGLEDKAEARIATLSGGQRRRLDVALGIIGAPKVLFLDEPTTGFDPQARREFWSVILGLKDEGTTILLTTHDMAEAAMLADRIGIVAGGVIAHEGTVATLGTARQRTPMVTWVEAGQQQCERTETPAAFIADLRYRLGGEPEQLSIERPGLEDIYLSIVGSEAGRV